MQRSLGGAGDVVVAEVEIGLIIRSQQVAHVRRVEVGDESLEEGHLFVCVFQNNAWVGRRAAQAIGREHHRQVRRVHLGLAHHLRRRELLQEADQVRQHLQRYFSVVSYRVHTASAYMS